MTDHYFSSSAGEYAAEPIRVRLGGSERSLEAPRGVFSNDGLDVGTAVLLDAVPEPPATGNLLDIGCGWGPLTLDLALSSRGATVWAVDVNPLALEATRRNARALSLSNVNCVAPEEIPADVRFDAIWSNPPIRIGKAALHELLTTWLGRLTTDGEAWLVVQKHLGADSLLRWLNQQPGLDAERATSKKTFRVLRVTRTDEHA